MDTQILRDIGLTENEKKIYLTLLRSEKATAYELSQKTGIYRVHVYDKLEQLMEKGLVSHIYAGAKKYFLAMSPSKLQDYLSEKMTLLKSQQKKLSKLVPELEEVRKQPKEESKVEVFKGKEGIKYFLNDIIKTKPKEVCITGIDDEKYNESLPLFMKQHFSRLKRAGIKERVITSKKKGVFVFTKKVAPTTSYRFLEEEQFNPANTFIYAHKVVIVSWGIPIFATMIENKALSRTYKNHFEYLWQSASVKN